MRSRIRRISSLTSHCAPRAMPKSSSRTAMPTAKARRNFRPTVWLERSEMDEDSALTADSIESQPCSSSGMPEQIGGFWMPQDIFRTSPSHSFENIDTNTLIIDDDVAEASLEGDVDYPKPDEVEDTLDDGAIEAQLVRLSSHFAICHILRLGLRRASLPMLTSYRMRMIPAQTPISKPTTSPIYLPPKHHVTTSSAALIMTAQSLLTPTPLLYNCGDAQPALEERCSVLGVFFKATNSSPSTTFIATCTVQRPWSVFRRGGKGQSSESSVIFRGQASKKRASKSGWDTTAIFAQKPPFWTRFP